MATMNNDKILQNCGVLLTYDEMMNLPIVICYKDNNEISLHLTNQMINSIAKEDLLNSGWEITLVQENLVRTDLQLEELIQFLQY